MGESAIGSRDPDHENVSVLAYLIKRSTEERGSPSLKPKPPCLPPQSEIPIKANRNPTHAEVLVLTTRMSESPRQRKLPP